MLLRTNEIKEQFNLENLPIVSPERAGTGTADIIINQWLMKAAEAGCQDKPMTVLDEKVGAGIYFTWDM